MRTGLAAAFLGLAVMGLVGSLATAPTVGREFINPTWSWALQLALFAAATAASARAVWIRDSRPGAADLFIMLTPLVLVPAFVLWAAAFLA